MAFRHIDSRQGLSQNSVFAITQDGDGFMWFGTRKGLNRYDGYHMLTFDASEGGSGGLIHNTVSELYFDKLLDCVWIGTDKGLSQYRPLTEDFRHYIFYSGAPEDSLTEVVRTVLRDREGALWVGTNVGLYQYQSAPDSFAKYPVSHASLPNSGRLDARILFEDADGRIWVGGNHGLFFLQADSLHYSLQRARDHYQLASVLDQQNIRFMEQDGQGILWIGTYKNGLFAWRPGQEPVHHLHDPLDPYSLSDDDVRVIGIDTNGKPWIGSFLGLNVYDPLSGRFHRYAQEVGNPRSLSGGSVRSICFDSRGSAWIGTYYGGVSHYNSDSYRFTHHEPKPGAEELSNSVVSAFWEDEAHNMWVGTEGGGINYWNRKEGSYKHFQYHPDQSSGFRGNNVKTILGQGDSLWVGTFASGLSLYHLRQKRWSYFGTEGAEGKRLASDNVYSMLQEGREMWIATYGGGLNIMDLQTGKVTIYDWDLENDASISSNLVRVLLRDRQNRKWVGTNEGLDVVEEQADGSLAFRHFLPGKMICSLLAASDGTIWAGTFQSGVYVLNEDGSLVHSFSTAEGLPGNAAFGILQDDKGRIWVSSERGLARIDRRDLSITNYNYSDGLDNLEYNFNACYKTRSGEMFFGGTRGFTSFFPHEIRTNTFVPPLVFTHLQAANQLLKPSAQNSLLQASINQTRQLSFPYNQANFTLGFAALDYLNPQNNQYAYKLEGLDQDWQYLEGQSEVSYTLQRSGQYTFRLRGGNNDGIWNQQERVLAITVLPPPWRSPMAYVLYISLLCLLIGGGYYLIRMRHRLQMEQLTKSQQEALHQAKLRFYTNVTHEFRTPLTLILGPLEDLLHQSGTDEKDRRLITIRRNAKRLLRLVNQLLNFRSLERDHGQLQVAEGNIVKFLREVYLSFQEQARLSGISYTFETETVQIPIWYDRDMLEKVFYNLLSNAFKFTPSGGNISLSIARREEAVTIKICDSGPGIAKPLHNKIFERYFHGTVPGLNPQEGTGIGLALSKELVDMHGGHIELESALGKGACFSVILPAGNAHFSSQFLLSDFKDSEQMEGYLQKASSERKGPEADLFTSKPGKAEQEKLLVIEDNIQVRDYVVEIFSPYFKVLTAPNGKEGLMRAREVMPDLIISDVMMPEMDGITLCTRLKRDISTSHIPVILLTARTGQIFRVEGLETGADAYINKPFSPYELQLRVRNLLDTRARIRERFHAVLKLEPSEITVTSADENFLTRALEIVETHIENPDFTVEVFARELAVSRPLLFTKLKAITSQTPNNFVKAIRLKRSAQLLKDSDLGVAEVAYHVGFRDARYFSKCFQKEFGKKPSTFRQQQEAKVID